MPSLPESIATGIRHDVARLARCFESALPPGSVVMLAADNAAEWIWVDLALQSAGLVVIPIAGFFAAEQIHTIRAHYPVSAAVGDRRALDALGCESSGQTVPGTSFVMARMPDRSAQGDETHGPFPSGAKLTFTSGSTGHPKGIVIRKEHQWCVAESIAQTLRGLGLKRHLVMLPLPILLENIAGVYTALMLGAEIRVPPLADIGFSGSSQFDPERALAAINASASESIIVMPHMLQLMIEALRSTSATASSLRYVAVGGAHVPPALLESAREVGLPVYEGYGLTEAASVVCMNTPAAHRVGTVGRPLPHQAVRIAPDGEILVRWSVFEALQNDEPSWFATGDLGELDSDGFLIVKGRKKNLLITSFGRNVSPEWPEGLLMELPEVAQAMVFGDGEPSLSALLVPRHPGTDLERLEACVAAVNARLPDYARIGKWQCVAPFTPAEGTLTTNGRLRREKILEKHCVVQADSSIKKGNL